MSYKIELLEAQRMTELEKTVLFLLARVGNDHSTRRLEYTLESIMAVSNPESPEVLDWDAAIEPAPARPSVTVTLEYAGHAMPTRLTVAPPAE